MSDAPTPAPAPTYPATRQGFMDAYRSALIERWHWARADPMKLNRFMGGVHDTLKGQNVWGFDRTSPATVTAWLMIGMNGKPSLNKLRHLPLAAQDVL